MHVVQPPEDTLILQPRVQRRDDIVRPTRAEIDLNAVAHNLDVLRDLIAPARVLAVIKADAYGHGVVPIARRLQKAQVSSLGVALAEEAIELREAGVDTEVLILNGIIGNAHEEIIRRKLTPVVYRLEELERFGAAMHKHPNERLGIHVKVNTGMHRLGLSMAKLESFLLRACDFKSIEITGVMTHLASADDDDEFTRGQIGKFRTAINTVRSAGFNPKTLHAANTAGAIRFPDARFDLIRSGIGLFGHPSFDLKSASISEHAKTASAALRPAMRIRSEIITLVHVDKGDRVGYSGSYAPSGPRTLAILPIGYGDGLLRANSSRGHVLIRGQRCPVVGRVSMDLTHVDVTHVDGASVRDEAVILGASEENPGAVISLDELAESSGTAYYEVLTNVSRRVPRFYF